MTETATKQTLKFQTEVQQLLHIVIHSLYSNKEIFLRELISNASDANDKLRMLALNRPDLYEKDSELGIWIDVDKANKTIAIRDNGIGMNKAEIIENLGTIARSGTKEFLKNLNKDSVKDANLIGQFGVGFYSSFIVADKVTVKSRKAGESEQHGVEWQSTGEGEFLIENIDKTQRGTEVILHLKSDEEEFLEEFRLKNIIHKYSDHIPFKIYLQKMNDKGEPTGEYEVANKATALWTLPKSQITDAEYTEFYKHIAHDFQAPLIWSHNKVEGKMQYIMLLYIPEHAPFDLWNRDRPRGLKLYVQRVFIMDDAEELVPMYLRFVKGVVDSSDLPLNISREILQQNRIIDSIRAAVVKRVLSMLEDLANNQPEKYQTFWNAFGQVLKEGIAEDGVNREIIAKLLRFATTHQQSSSQTISLDEYVKRMQPNQEKIYYITADNYGTAVNSPHLEMFKKKSIEVILLTDPIDEWVVMHLHEYQGKKLQSITKGDVPAGETEEEKAEQKKIEENFSDVVTRIKQALGDKVKEVRVSHRLTDSPACIVFDEQDINAHMQRMLKAAGHKLPEAKPILEINPEHQLINTMQTENNSQRFENLSELLLEQSILAEGGQLPEPARFVKRLNELLINK